ncbi:MAG: hypothetical protein AAF658_07050, partial [Myxococcota bacterium]
NWLSAQGSVRLGLIFIGRDFSDGRAPSQNLATFTPGLGGALRAEVTDWLSVGAQIRLHYGFFTVDENSSLVYLDGGAVVSVHLP